MAFNEVCRICLRDNVSTCVLKKTSLRNLYKTMTNCFMDEDEPIMVCFTCHARLIRCGRLQQQAIESNAVLEQLLAGGSMAMPKPHEAADEIQFTPICHIDIRPVKYNIKNDCKDEIFSLESVKVEENFENENSKIEVNGNYEIEQPCTQTNNFSKPCEKQIESNSTDCKINDVRKGNVDIKSPTIKSKPKLKRDTQPFKKGKHPAKIMKNKILKQSVNKLTINTSEASTKYIFKCDDCSKKFSTKDSLADHISYSHKTQKNLDAVQTQVKQTPVPQLMDIYNCDICEFKTSQKRWILAHLKAHVAKEVYCCNNCDYKCSDKRNFQRHVKIHTRVKPFSCNNCEYKCIQKTQLQKHMKIHTTEKPFSCIICEHKFTIKTDLMRHIKIHTGEKLFSCNICKHKFTTENDLMRHIKIHTGENFFPCNICKHKFTTETDLIRHIKKHTGGRPLSCNICEFRCITKSCLLRHMKMHIE